MDNGFFGPNAIIAQLCVGEDDHSAHDGGDGDLGGLPSFHEPDIASLHLRIEAAGDERWHIEGLAEKSSDAAVIYKSIAYGVAPQAWLTEALARINDHKINDLATLLS
ncbi:hypothetical protein [Methylosinus sp. PW1]|uniref:hypothetical protein n=1 Tax=Methylosinus sp. PW1 TaxID=107636 RepID=UPI0012EC6D06|nr:hypothetical protein [Methylosinus sp. PW1]